MHDGRAYSEYRNTIANVLMNSLPEELGIIVHKYGGDDVAAVIMDSLTDDIKERVKFCTWYGTGLAGFWDEAELEKDLPYNVFRNAVRDNLAQTDAFDRVWGFFLVLNEAVLEAKLALIQSILNEAPPAPETVNLLREKVAGFDRHFGDFVRVLTPNEGRESEDGERHEGASNFYKRFEELVQLSGDVFSREYQTAFETFRDALGVE
jgi:RNAse (barnase) inhibitor barstar